MYTLLDSRNESFISESNDLFNTEEILDNVRKELPRYIILVPATIGAIIIGVLLGMFIPSIFYVKGFILLWHIAVICFTLSIFTIVCWGIYIGFRWRVGLKDKTLVSRIIKYGKVTNGTVVAVEHGKITYKYQIETEEFKSSFSTVHWDKCQIDDKIKVVYVYNIFGFPL